MSELRQLFVRLRSATTEETFAPPELRSRIVGDVEEQESNLNDVVVAILAKRYGVPFEAKGRRAHPSANDDVLALRVPQELLTAIDRASLDHERNRQDETLWALCTHYKLSFEPGRKRNGPKRLPAAA